MALTAQCTFEFLGVKAPDPDVSFAKVRDFKVEPCSRSLIEPFIKRWHYSANMNGCNVQYAFRLMHENTMIGAAFFGWPAMAGQWKRFADTEPEVIELRRLCCVDKTPRNTESFFIGHMLRWLRKNTNHSVVISYADMEHGHMGTIYKASNFECLGESPGAKVVLYNGKRYHDKALRTKYKGELKPFALELRKAVENGQATMKSTAGKVTYVYRLR